MFEDISYVHMVLADHDCDSITGQYHICDIIPAVYGKYYYPFPVFKETLNFIKHISEAKFN
jgi:hypothetical protein